MAESYMTTDIWLVSYLLCKTNAELANVTRKRNTFEFVIVGEGLSSLAHSYKKQEVLVNVVELKNRLNFLRDIIFESRRISARR